MKLYSKSENIKQVKTFYDALSGGNLGAAFGILDPDLEWKEPNVPALWFRGIHYGADALRKAVRIEAFHDIGKWLEAIVEPVPVGERPAA